MTHAEPEQMLGESGREAYRQTTPWMTSRKMVEDDVRRTLHAIAIEKLPGEAVVRLSLGGESRQFDIFLGEDLNDAPRHRFEFDGMPLRLFAAFDRNDGVACVSLTACEIFTMLKNFDLEDVRGILQEWRLGRV